MFPEIEIVETFPHSIRLGFITAGQNDDARMDHLLFFGQTNTQHLQCARLADDSWIIEQLDALPGAQFGRIRQIPDGKIFVMGLKDGRVWEAVPAKRAIRPLITAPIWLSYLTNVFAGHALVALETDTEGASICYSTEGADPLLDGIGYSGPFLLRSGANLKLAGSKPGYLDAHDQKGIRPALTQPADTTVFAGSASETGSDDGHRLNARFSSKLGLAVDSTDRLLIADEFNHRIRRVDHDGTVSTLAGMVFSGSMPMASWSESCRTGLRRARLAIGMGLSHRPATTAWEPHAIRSATSISHVPTASANCVPSTTGS